VHATLARVTFVRCARITVVTILLRSRLAGAILALVVQRAGISIPAGSLVELICAPGLGVTGVISARIVVCTIGRNTLAAHPCNAFVANGARIAVVTSECFVVGK